MNDQTLTPSEKRFHAGMTDGLNRFVASHSAFETQVKNAGFNYPFRVEMSDPRKPLRGDPVNTADLIWAGQHPAQKNRINLNDKGARYKFSGPTVDDVHQNPYMSNLALQAIPDMFFATDAVGQMTVNRSSGEFARIDSKAIYRAELGTGVDSEATITPGQVAGEIYMGYDKVSYSTAMYGLRTFVHDSIYDNVDAPLKPLGDAVLLCSLPVMTIREQLIGTALTTTSNYATANRVTTSDALLADTANIRKQVQLLQNTIRAQSTKEANRLIMNDTTFIDLIHHASAQRNTDIRVSPAQARRDLADLCGVSEIVVYGSYRNTAGLPVDPSAKGNTTQTLAQNFPNGSSSEKRVALVNADSRLLYNTTWGMIFQNSNRNFQVRRYRDEAAMSTIYECRAEFGFKVLDNTCGGIFTDA